MRISICLFFLLLPVLALAEDHEEPRDPFWPLVSSSGTILTYDGKVGVSDIVLEGIVTDSGGGNLAIINGNILKVGDQFGEYVVEFIKYEEVGLLKGQEHIVVRTKKEEK